MSIDHRLAVYGTLAPGRSNHHQLVGLDGHWRAGAVRGRLVAEGWAATEGYPALFPDPAGPVVEIQLFESADLPRHWERLDDFEGPGYHRIAIAVSTGEETVDAWIYAAADAQP
jgi:gamma-glutamylcyclotransferase (GGCT)/AIG2-like uncharacterized protein YtfP